MLSKSTPARTIKKMSWRRPMGIADDGGVAACCGVVEGVFTGG